MGSPAKNTLGGSIHRVREFELEKVNLADEFDILQIVGEGWFGKILLVEHKGTDTEMVLKALPKPYTSLRDFYREFHFGLHLSAHKNVITTYDVAFETPGFFVFSQEYAPLGDLTSNISEMGIGELHSKRVAKQLAAALEHLHSRDLVHRDVKLDNILVFKSDFSRIKLCDFGETRRTGSVVLRRNEWLPYAPPEVLNIPNDENYKADTTHDVWQFGIVIFVCLTGCLPWQKAAPDDPRYVRYLSWHSSTMPIKRQPKLFKLISSKAQRLFKKFLEPRSDKRPVGLTEIQRFLEDRWMSKGGVEKTNNATPDDGLCPSMYSFHSSPEEKNKLLFTLTQYGIETTVDRRAKKDRIREWIQASVIEEEDIQEINQVQNANHEEQTHKRERRLLSFSTKPDVYIPPIDPRIPLELQRLRNGQPETINGHEKNIPNQIPSILKSQKTQSNGNAKKHEIERTVHFNTIEPTFQEGTQMLEEDTRQTVFTNGIRVQIPQSSQLYNTYERHLSPTRPARTRSKQNGHPTQINGITMSSPVVTRKYSGRLK